MKGRRGAVAALIFATAVASAAEPAPSGPGSPAAWIRIEAFVRARMEAGRIPGLAIAVADSAGRTAARGYGVSNLGTGAPVTPETLFAIGSLSKAFTAVLVLRLAEAKQLDVEAPVTRVLPWFQPPSGARPPTIHQLLTHTAGLPGDRDDIPSPLPVALSVRDLRGTGPGSAGFHYSNIGYQAAGLALEAAAHRTYAELLRTEILERLGMAATSGAITASSRAASATGYAPAWDDRPPHPRYPLVEAPWVEYAAADGSILSNAADMGRWLRMLLARGAAPGGRLLSGESFERMVRPWVRISPLDPWAYGYGFFVRSAGGGVLLRHTGGMPGFTSALEADLGKGLAVVVLANVAAADSRPTDIANFVLETLAADAAGEPPPEAPAPNPARVPNAGEYAGTFVSVSGEKLVLSADGDRLFLVRDGKRHPLEPRGEDRFWVDHPDFALHFLRFWRQNGRPVEAAYGPSWYVAASYEGPRSFEIPKEWAPLRGHYRANSPWTSNFRVFFRKGKLFLETAGGDERLLVPVEPGLFRVGEERVPETLRFDEIVDGWAQRAVFSGVPFYRFFTP